MQNPVLDSSLKPRWYALYTKSRHEKFIDGELKKRRMESFLPIRTIKRRWSDRTVTVEEPLFKSYLFVKTDILQAKEVLKTKGAVTFVRNGQGPVPVQEKVIQSLMDAVRLEIPLDPFPYLAEGDRVTVRSGVFKGIEGFVLRKDEKKCRLVISIDAMMASVSVEVDSCLVEKV